MASASSMWRRLDPAGWSGMAQAWGLLAPAVLALACDLLAMLCPDRFVWTVAAGSLLLSAPRWCMALWPLWAAIFAWRAPVLRPPAVIAGVLGLLLMGRPETDPPGPGALVLSTNVNAYSPDTDPAHLQDAIANVSADLVLVIEKRAIDVPGMRRAADNFADDLPRTSHALAVFCREGVDCSARVTAETGSETSKMPMAFAVVGGVCVIGIHAPPPAPFDPTGIGPYIEEIAGLIVQDQGRMARDAAPCRAGDPVVVVGDMNAVPRSSAWRRLVATGLRDARATTGVFGATWPAGGGWLNLPVMRLDHLFVGAAKVSGVASLRMPATDHKALLFRVVPE